MNEQDVVVIDDVIGFNKSAEGSYTLISIENSGQKIVLALKQSVAAKLSQALSKSAGVAASLTGELTQVTAQPVDNWRVGTVPGTDSRVLMLEASQIVYSFVLNSEQLEYIAQSLDFRPATTGQPPIQSKN